MSTDPDPAPPASLLEHLDSDSWAVLLTTARQVLQQAGPDLPADADRAALAALVDTPVGRLSGGRGRRRAAAAIADAGWLWTRVGAALRTRPDRPPALDWLLTHTDVVAPGPDHGGADPQADERVRRDRDRDRLRTLREERDRLTRQLDGATSRTERLTADLEQLGRELADERATVQRLTAELAGAAAERSRAVERERRRRDAELAGLRDELTTLRRAETERRAAPPRPAAARVRDDVGSPSPTVGGAGFRPGRPSRLPDGVVPGTTEAASWLLGPGRRVLVDGYNVTLRHRPQLDLEAQRGWLLQLLAAGASRLGLRPEVVFDGDRGGSGRVPPGVRGVRVRFTADGVTADDELVLDVEATDEPLTVVTDDRELTARVTLAGADVVGTTSFLGVLG